MTNGFNENNIMNMKSLRLVLAATLICGIGLFCSCTKDNNNTDNGNDINVNLEEQIIGTWKVVDTDEDMAFEKNEIMVINADHTLIFEGLTLTWSLEGNHIHATGNSNKWRSMMIDADITMLAKNIMQFEGTFAYAEGESGGGGGTCPFTAYFARE